MIPHKCREQNETQKPHSSWVSFYPIIQLFFRCWIPYFCNKAVLFYKHRIPKPEEPEKTASQEELQQPQQLQANKSCSAEPPDTDSDTAAGFVPG